MNALLFTFAWILVALAVLGIAFLVTRDKDAEPTYKGNVSGGGRIAIALGAALLIVGIPALVLDKTSDRIPSGAGTFTVNSTEAERNGRVVFRETCASCHTLAAANARGVYGPDLDEQLGAPGGDPAATAARVETAIKTGGVTGKQMPAGLLDEGDAKLVAQYVAAVAGK
ncbi:MAG: c-type cytochrome [Solirubrobacterales bacterium]